VNEVVLKKKHLKHFQGSMVIAILFLSLYIRHRALSAGVLGSSTELCAQAYVHADNGSNDCERQGHW